MRRRRPRGRSLARARVRSAALVAVLFIALVLVVPLALDGFNLLQFQPVGPTPAAARDESLDGEWYSLYFTAPSGQSDDVPAHLAAAIDGAQDSVDIAIMELNLDVIAEALLRAAERGVRVRLVIDTDNNDHAVIARLKAGGIPIREDGRDELMHHKFTVIDGAEVWTGSMNYTHSEAYRNDNVVIRLASTRLAQNYGHEFDEMYERGRFGSTSPADTPHPRVTLNGTTIENYFSPDDGVAARVLPVLQGAERSIHFMAFAFTRQDFANALIDRAQDGVLVQGVFETRQIAAGANQAWQLLTQAGLDVRQDGNQYNMHSKVFIVDESVVIMGSYNFSNNAERNNDENILIIYNADIARLLMEEWRRVWAEAG